MHAGSYAKQARPLHARVDSSIVFARPSTPGTTARESRRPTSNWIRRFIFFHGKRTWSGRSVSGSDAVREAYRAILETKARMELWSTLEVIGCGVDLCLSCFVGHR